VVSLAGQGRIEEARQVLEGLAVAEPRTLLGILLGLTKLAERIPKAQRQELGHLQLQAARRLDEQRAALDEGEQRLLDESRAEAYLAAGNIYDAALLYESLLKTQPRDRRLLRIVTELLEQQGTPEALRRAKEFWQRIEALEKRGDRAWLEARLHVAECAQRVGDTTEARKLIGVARALYPELGGADLKQRFEALERKLPASASSSQAPRP
jgi:tetratricopeptide (TPR) repeat protein